MNGYTPKNMIKRLMKNPKNTLLGFLLAMVFTSYAQLYPVQLSPVINPPYSANLSDYATTLDEKIRLLVNPTDIGITNRQVRLKLYIQGNGITAESRPLVQGMNPIFINGGELITLTNNDFKALFRLENLQGLTAVQYANPLPEGMYSICFEVYDVITNQRLSQKSCTSIYLMLNDPPLLNTPTLNEQVAVAEFPNILFTWTPRQINATNVSYVFELKELQNPTIDPQFGFQMSPMLHQEELYATSLLYDLSKPVLIPGKRYAWRVKAISTSGLSQNNVFKNDGYSEIFWFTYQSTCDAPSFVLSQVQTPSRVKVSWQGETNHTKYHVQYRKQNVPGAEWFSLYTLNTQAIITNLEAGEKYEFRVGASCDPINTPNLSFTYSGINQFVMPREDATVNSEYNCGITPTINIENQVPLTNLIVGETFTAGDFPVTVMEVTGQGSYSGIGYTVVPYLADTKLAVVFDNIVINTDYQLIQGVVETSYNVHGINISDLEDLSANDEVNDVQVDFEIVDVTINPAGDIVVSGPNGEQITIPGGSNVQITDSNGTVYTVDANNNVSDPQVLAQGGAPNLTNTDGVNQNGQVNAITAQGIRVTFTKADANRYGFDAVASNDHNNIKALYTKLTDDYYMPYKSVLNSNEGGQEDYILAKVTITNNDIVADSLVFKTGKGLKIPHTKQGDQYVLKLKSNFSNTEEDVLATIKQGNKYKVAGAFKYVHLAKKKTAQIVLVNAGGNVTESSNLESYLNTIYAGAGASFDVVASIDFDIQSYLTNPSEIRSGESGFAAQYTQDQQRINAALRNSSTYNQYPEAYFMVCTNIPPSTVSENGIMPLGRQFGYIYNGKSKTVAHELGHGIFELKHPFSSSAQQTPQGVTNWLMDYGTGEKIPYVHWKQIQNPKWRIGLFDDDGEGEHVVVSNMEYLDKFKNSDGTYTFISLSGKPISLPAETSSVTFSIGDDLNLANCQDKFKIEPFGALKHFKINGKEYSFCAACNSNVFAGYFEKGSGCNDSAKYIDAISNESKRNAIVGMPCMSGNDVVFKVLLLENYFDGFDFATLGTNYNGQGELKPYNHIIESLNNTTEFVYIPAHFDPKFDEEVKQFLKSEWCNCSENDFSYVANGFVYATQLQKHKEYFGCFQNGLPLFFYDENINSDKLQNVIVKDWENTNINGFVQLKSDIEKFRNISEYLSDRYTLYKFLKKYIPEEISDSKANTYSLRLGTSYWDSGLVLDKIQNISDNDILKQFDDVFCLWESIPLQDRIEAIKVIANGDSTDVNERSEEIVLYLVINAPNKQAMIDALKAQNYALFWKVWEVLDKAQRSYFVAFLNENLIDNNTKEKGRELYNTFYQNCENSLGELCDLNTYKVLPIVRSNAFDVVSSSFDFGPGGSAYQLEYSLETTEENPKIHIDASSEYINYDDVTTYWDYFFTSGNQLFNSSLDPFDTMVLYAREEMKLNGKTILNKGDIATVPVIFLHWLDSGIDSEQNQAVLRIAADGLVVGSIILSGGATSPLLAVDLVVAGTDFVFQVANETSANVDPELLETWDALYNIYAIANLPRAFRATISAGEYAANGVSKLFTFVENTNTVNKFSKFIVSTQFLDDFIVKYNQFSSVEKLAALKHIDDLILAIKNTPRLNANALIPRSLYRNLIDVRLKLANASMHVPSIATEVQASSEVFVPYLKIKNGADASVAVANVVPMANATKPVLTNVRWLPAAAAAEDTKVVGAINDVRFIDEHGVPRVGVLEVVEQVTNSGQFYLIKGGAIEGGYIDLLQKYYPNLLEAYNALSASGKLQFELDFARNVNLLSSLNESTVFLEGWKRLNEVGAHVLLKRNVNLLDKTNKFIESGFTNSNLSSLSKFMDDLSPNVKKYVDRYGKEDRNLTRDENFVKIAGDIMTSMMDAKIADYFSKYGVETNVIKQLNTAIQSGGVRNLEELDYFMMHMARETKTTPGDIVHLNYVVDKLKNGHKIHIESNKALYKVDIVDETVKEAIELKTVTSVKDKGIKSKIVEAANQVLANETPSGFKKISMVKLLNPSNPVYNKSSEELLNWLQKYYNNVATTNNGPILKNLDVIRIENNTGLHNFKVDNSGTIIKLN